MPEDLAVVGYDDTPLAGLFVPALSSVRIDTAILGRYVAELALYAAGALAEEPTEPAPPAQIMRRETI